MTTASNDVCSQQISERRRFIIEMRIRTRAWPKVVCIENDGIARRGQTCADMCTKTDEDKQMRWRGICVGLWCIYIEAIRIQASSAAQGCHKRRRYVEFMFMVMWSFDCLVAYKGCWESLLLLVFKLFCLIVKLKYIYIDDTYNLVMNKKNSYKIYIPVYCEH